MLKINRKQIFVSVLLLLIGLLLVADRVLWASVSPWREDQATNLWLGYTQHLSNIPVGLISSQGIPNPNGMVILGYFLSFLPTLWLIGSFLGCLQAVLVLLLCWRLFPTSIPKFLLIAVPLLTSVVLRASSVEFWNQWIMTLPNLLFFIWANEYLNSPNLWKIPFWVILICIAPSIYLAGIVNAVVMGILGCAIIIFRPPPGWRTGWWKPALISVFILMISLLSTWIPYFQAITLRDLMNFNYGEPLSLLQKLRYIAESVFSFPAYAGFQWADISLISIFQYNEKIISRPASIFILISCWTYLIESFFAFGFLLLGLYHHYRSRHTANSPLAEKINQDIASPVIFSYGFIVLSYVFSIGLGGPVWVRDQRTDQLIQYLPSFLVFVFLAPFCFKFSPKVELFRSKIIYSLAAIFAISSAIGGILIVDSNQHYLGKVLSQADAPLTQKNKVVDFIVRDWKTISNDNKIPVDYQLGGGIWDWVPEFGQRLEKWYPAPMTFGRSFDYDLRRRYGLTNSQEGIQLRAFGTGRYLVNYSFKAAPIVDPTYSVQYFLIGRFRVTIVDR